MHSCSVLRLKKLVPTRGQGRFQGDTGTLQGRYRDFAILITSMGMAGSGSQGLL